MARLVFIDTSAWLAVADASDAYHPAAVAVYKGLLDTPCVLVTTVLALAETQILLRRRLGSQPAMAFLTSVNHSARVQVLYPASEEETEAKLILQTYSDQDFSLADAISFVVMRRLGIQEAFTYDQHFSTAGFTLLE
jgi:predicted nucleic acid-binding protein